MRVTATDATTPLEYPVSLRWVTWFSTLVETSCVQDSSRAAQRDSLWESPGPWLGRSPAACPVWNDWLVERDLQFEEFVVSSAVYSDYCGLV